MSFAGSVSAMLTSLKNNKIPKRERKLGNKEYVEGVPIGKPLKFKNKLSVHEMEALREKLKLQRRKNLRMTIVAYIISIIIASGLVFHYLY